MRLEYILTPEQEESIKIYEQQRIEYLKQFEKEYEAKLRIKKELRDQEKRKTGKKTK
jgi:hypothetical protein